MRVPLTVATPAPIVVDGRIITRPQCRGIGRSLIGLVSAFPCEAGDGSVKVLIEEGGESPFDLDGMARRAELVPTRLPIIGMHRGAAVRSLLRDLRAGVVYSPYHPLAPLLAPCPVVAAVHDCIIEEDPSFAGGRWQQRAFVTLSRLALSRIDAVTVDSVATAKAVARHYPRVDVRAVVPNGIAPLPATDDPGAEAAHTRHELGLPERYLLHVGARRPHKNQVLLLEMLSRLDAGVALVMVGDTDPRMADPVPATVDALGLRGRVLLLERVADRLMRGLYAGAEAFVFPSVAEGYGLPPLEAMSAGVPVVASSIPVMAEVCGDAALLVSPHQPEAWARAVSQLRTDPALRGALVARGRQRAAAATPAVGARVLYSLLRSYASGAQPPHGAGGSRPGHRQLDGQGVVLAAGDGGLPVADHTERP